MRDLRPGTGCAFCELAENVGSNGVRNCPEHNVIHFEPINPVTQGHRLFVPDWHVEHPNVLATAEAMSAAEHWSRSHSNTDYNLITSSGPAATQTVPHLHVHYVPRRPGDGLLLPWGGPR